MTSVPLSRVGAAPIDARVRERIARAVPRTTDARWNALLVFSSAYVLFAVGRVHQLIPGLSAVRPVLIAAVLALAALLTNRRAFRRVGPLLNSPVMLWLAAFFVWAALSIPGALYQGGAFAIVVDGLLKSLVMLVAIAAASRGPRDAQRLALAFFAAAAVYSVFIIVQFGATARSGVLEYYDPNDFAVLAVMSMPLGIYGLRYARGWTARVLSAAGLAAVALAFVWTESRGGFLACLAVAALGLLTVSAVPRRWRITGLSVIGLTVVFAAGQTYWNRMRTITGSQEDYNRIEETGRFAIWKRGIGYMMDHPVLGVGANNFPTAEGTISPLARLSERGVGVKWSAAHNTYIQVGAETGIPGLILFVGAMTWAFILLRREQRMLKGDPAMRALAQLGLVSLAGFAVGATFLSLAYSDMLYVMYGIVLAIVFARRTRMRDLARRAA